MTDETVVRTSKECDLREAAEFAADVLAELYAKYSIKIGPFASQAQVANVRLRDALKHAPTPETNPVGWQPIDPSHPPSGRVIIAMPDGWVTEGDYAAGNWWHGGRALSGTPTHYLPMPNAPTQKAGDGA